jgi:hypothetical protein
MVHQISVHLADSPTKVSHFTAEDTAETVFLLVRNTAKAVPSDGTKSKAC